MVETTAPAEDEDDGAEESAEAAEDTAAASVDANGLPLGFFDTPQQEVTEVDHARDISRVCQPSPFSTPPLPSPNVP